MRVLLAIALLGFAALSSVGFLATFEPTPGAIAWRFGYGVVTVACLGAAVALLRSGPDEPR
jgi:hypothetical protein